MPTVSLREATEDDFESLFELESDVAGADMIAFLPRDPGDRDAFAANWARIRTDATVLTRIIEADARFAGYAISFLADGERQIGYWIVRELWKRGIASAALAAFVDEINQRPLWGSTASDNVGSQRVLQNVGFVYDHTKRTHAPRRGTEIDENIYRLD